MLGFQFPLRFILRPFRADLLGADNPSNAGCESGGKSRGGDDVFVGALGVGGDEADG